MEVAIVVLFLGVLIFLGNVFNRVFALTKIPDLLILIGIGLLIGPVLGLVSPTEYGIVGPLFATVTLAVILFEGGLHLKMTTIRSAFRGTIELTLISFVVTMLISAGILIFLNLLEPLPALMLGAAIGGTSSAVVIPMIEYLHLGKDSQAILALESAITDVLCIVLLLTLLDIYIIGELNVPYVALRLVSSFFIAAILGVIGGIAWSVLYPHLKTIKSIFLTPAFLFIIYGVVTLLGFSGAIAALAFGITLGNLHSFQYSQVASGITCYASRTHSPRSHVSLAARSAAEDVFLHLSRPVDYPHRYRSAENRAPDYPDTVCFKDPDCPLLYAEIHPGLGRKHYSSHDPERTRRCRPCSYPSSERCYWRRIYRNDHLCDHPVLNHDLFRTCSPAGTYTRPPGSMQQYSKNSEWKQRPSHRTCAGLSRPNHLLRYRDIHGRGSVYKI